MGEPVRPWKGDLWWIANDGESGFGDPYEAYEAATDYADHDNEPVCLSRATTLPEVWAVRVTKTWDEDGNPDDSDIELFNTKEEATAASSDAPNPLLPGAQND